MLIHKDIVRLTWHWALTHSDSVQMKSFPATLLQISCIFAGRHPVLKQSSHGTRHDKTKINSGQGYQKQQNKDPAVLEVAMSSAM